MKESIIKKIQNLEGKMNEKLKSSNIEVKILDFHYNDGVMLIIRDKKIAKVFILKAVASGQVDILENAKVIANGLFVNNLGMWIYNLYNPVKYLYKFVGGNLDRKILTREEIDKIATGITENIEKLRAKGATTHGKELDNQPIVKGYLGPMFEKIDYGKIYLRYETQEIYDMVSK